VYDPLVKRLLALDKRERYDSASEFLAELRGVQLFEKAEEKVTEK
jgi:hypothetical protein